MLAVPAPARSPAQPRVYQGHGSATEGGLAGDVYHVTSLADSGPGSFREGVTRRSGARTIVFDVAGTVTLESPLTVRGPFLTVKGSSAPAPGITIQQGTPAEGVVLEGTHDVILENLRFVGASAAGAPDASGRAALVIDGRGTREGARRIIVDHVSVRGSGEDGLALRGTVSDVSISWSLFASNHPDARTAPSASARRISVHHSIFAKGALLSTMGNARDLDVVNNVVYDWSVSGAAYGLWIRGKAAGSIGNVVANAFLPATASPEAALVYGSLPGPDGEDGGPSGPAARQGAPISTTRLGRLWVFGNALPAENQDQYSTQATPVAVPALAQVTAWPMLELGQRMLPEVGMAHRDVAEAALLEEIASALPTAPAFSIDDVSTPEGASGGAGASFAVTLSSPSDRRATVRYATADGTATAGSDYKSASGVLTFAPGVTAQTVTVSIQGDELIEGDETFSLNLSEARNATVAHGQGRGTIVDDESPAVSITVGDARVTEGDQGSRNVLFELALSAASPQRVTVAYATAADTAVAGSDYTATAGTAEFPPGTTKLDVAVAVLGDTVVESEETFSLVLTDPSGASLARASGRATIADGDAPVKTGASANSKGVASAKPTGTASGTLPSSAAAAHPAVAAAAAAGTTYHVANAWCSHGNSGCSDSNSGLSRSAPLCTVQAGLNKLAPGSADTLAIHSGTYVDNAELPNWVNTGGASVSTPITIEGAPGDPKSGVILRGTATQSTNRSTPSTANTAVLRIAGKGSTQRIRNVRVRGLTIHPGNVRGIFVFNGSYIEVDNVDFLNWQGNPSGGDTAAAFAVKGSDHLTLKNSRMTNGGVQQAGASGIEIGGGGSDILIYNNIVHDFQGGCFHGSSNGSGKGRVLFAQNDFRNCKGDTNETATFQIYNDQDFMFYGNLVVVPSNGYSEVFSIRRTSSQDSSSAHIIGNTVINNATRQISAVRVWGQIPDAAVVRNNIFVGFDKNPSNAIIRLEYLTPCSGYDEDYNYVYGLPSQPLMNLSTCSVQWGPHTTVTSTVAPGLDASYAPLAGAPVVNAGDPKLAYPALSLLPKDIGVFDLGVSRFPIDHAVMATTSSTTPKIRWDGTPQSGDIVLQARNRPTTTQSAFRVQIDTLPTFDSQGIWTPLVDSGHVSSTSTSWTPGASLPAGTYHARVTVSDTSFDQEWSDPYFRFAVASSGSQLPGISVNDVSTAEGSGAVATFAISLSNAGTQTITVAYATADGTARSGNDYAVTSGTLTFQPAETAKTVAVPVLNDGVDEDAETFTLNLSGAVNATIADGQGLTTVTDDDPSPALSIGDASRAEGNTGTADAVMSVTLSPASERSVTVQYATADAAASAPSDYTSRSGVLTFSPGTTSQTLSIPVVGDSALEPDETFLVNLSSPSNATLADAQGVVTITNDENPPPSGGSGLVVYVRDVSSGPVGSFVTLYGRGFTTSGTVTFGGEAAAQVPLWSDSKIIVAIPSGATSGDLVVSAGGASASSGTFMVRAGRIFYVSGSSGNDGSGGTQAAPWRTLAHASATVAAGDVVLIRAGTYAENNGGYGMKLSASGTASQPILFRGFPGEVARIKVSGSTRSDSVRISGSYNVLSGVQVSDSGMQGVAVSGSNNVIFDCEIFNNHMSTTYGATGSGVNIVLGTQGNKVYANNIHHNGSLLNQDHGLYLKGSSIDVAWNDVGYNAGYGVQLYESAGSVYTGVVLRNNVFHHNGNSGVIVSKGASGASVYNNVFHSNTQAGLQVNYTPVSNLSVYNNTSYQNGTWELDIVTGSTVALRNNIASSTSGNVLRVASTVSGFSSDYNLFGPGAVKFSYNGTTHTSFLAYQSASGKDASSRAGDPLFVAPGSGNFLLQAGSPALDRGTATGAPTADRFGVARPQGPAWDIGAHEGAGAP